MGSVIYGQQKKHILWDTLYVITPLLYRELTEPECDRDYSTFLGQNQERSLSEVDLLENITSQQLQQELDQIIENYKKKKNKNNSAKSEEEKFIISVWNLKQKWTLGIDLNDSENCFIYGDRFFFIFCILIDSAQDKWFHGSELVAKSRV